MKHTVSQNGALELSTVSDNNCTFSTLLKPIQGDVSPDGEKVIAIKIPNNAVQYERNTSDKNPCFFPAILYNIHDKGIFFDNTLKSYIIPKAYQLI